MTQLTPRVARGSVAQHTRWMIRSDMPEVLGIEWASFESPWQEDDFRRCLRQRNCIGMVVVDNDDRVTGFMVYELFKTRVHILNFAVHPAHRREAVGSQMAAKLIGKLSAARRTRVVLEVRETNVAAQVFFRSQGFRAEGTLRGHYEDTDEDAYQMVYRFPLNQGE